MVIGNHIAVPHMLSVFMYPCVKVQVNPQIKKKY